MKKFVVCNGNRGATAPYRWRVWCGGNGRKFRTRDGAIAYAEAVYQTTGNICAVTEIKSRAKKVVDNDVQM